MSKYFDSINISYVISLLKSCNIPLYIIAQLEHFLRTDAINSNKVPLQLTWLNPREMVYDYYYFKYGVPSNLSPNEINLSEPFWKSLYDEFCSLPYAQQQFSYYRGLPQG